MEEDEGTLSIKLKLVNGVDFEGSASGHRQQKEWLKKFAEQLYADAKKQDEDDLIQGGYKPKEELVKAK